MDDECAVMAVQGAVTWMLSAEADCTVADALIRIIQAASHDLHGYSLELG